ncbi:MAG: hypothetical protein ACRDNF_21515 [Streptosporangiaceae bacterium]
MSKTTTPNSSPSTAPVQPSASSTPVSSTPAPSPSTAAQALVGVVGDCNSAPPLRLDERPASISLACADGGIGVEKVSWSTWTSSQATGQGAFWENLCQPSCAEGKIATYPVAITLSTVRTSAEGPWFSRLTVTWKGNRPPNSTPDSFPLMPPS